MKILSPAISVGRTAEEKRASRYQWLHDYGEDRECNSGRYWSAWSNQQYPISADIENPLLRRTGLPVLVEQIPAGVQARLRLKTTSFVSTLPRAWHGAHDLSSAFLTAVGLIAAARCTKNSFRHCCRRTSKPRDQSRLQLWLCRQCKDSSSVRL